MKRQTEIGSDTYNNLISDSSCRICNFSLEDKKAKVKVKYCEFCGLPACEECTQALRRLNNAHWDSLLDLKEDQARGKCCKLCVRKLIMKDQMEVLFNSDGPATPGQDLSTLGNNEVIQNGFAALADKIEEVNFQHQKIRRVQQTMTQQENEYQKNQEHLTRQIQASQEAVGEEQAQLIKLSNKERQKEALASTLRGEKEGLNKEN